MNSMSRRKLLVAGAAVLGARTLNANASATPRKDLPLIDAHSHIWSNDTSQFQLAPGMTTADLAPSSFTDEELMAVAEPEGVGRVVLIQHTLFHGYDNSYLIDAWRRHPDRFRVVGMVDDLRPNADRAMKQLLKQGVTGFRIRPRKGITNWLQTEGMQLMWKTAAETRQSMCCLINPTDLSAVNDACRQNPETPVVIDHFARIGIDGTIRDADVKSLCDLAQYRHVKVKISAYYALGRKQSPHHELIPMIKTLFEAFGADRLMWASDSPYQIDPENSYRSSISLIRDHIDFVSETERSLLLSGTAEKTFFFV